MVKDQLNSTVQKVGNRTLFLNRLKRLKCMKHPNLKKTNVLGNLECDHLSLWTSYRMLCFLNAIGVAQFQFNKGRLFVKHSLCSQVYVSFLFSIFFSIKTYFVYTETKHLHLLTLVPLWVSCAIVASNLIFSTRDSRNLCLIAGKVSQINEIMCKKHSEDHITKGSIFIIVECVVLACALFYYGIPDFLKTAFLFMINCHVAFIMIQHYEINLKLRMAFKEVNENLRKVADRYENEIFTASPYLPFVETVGQIERCDHLTIPVLVDLHWTLCKTVGKLGDCFGTKMLLVMVHFCIRVINTPFILITFWMNTRNRGKEDIVVVASKVVEVLMYVFEILFLIIPCVQTASEAKRTSHVICPLLNKYLPTNVRRQLEKSIQHLKLHNADFHPMGLFKFDLSIITSIAGFASTYLIIFVQQKASAKIFVDFNHNNTQNYSQT